MSDNKIRLLDLFSKIDEAVVDRVGQQRLILAHRVKKFHIFSKQFFAIVGAVAAAILIVISSIFLFLARPEANIYIMSLDYSHTTGDGASVYDINYSDNTQGRLVISNGSAGGVRDVRIDGGEVILTLYTGVDVNIGSNVGTYSPNSTDTISGVNFDRDGNMSLTLLGHHGGSHDVSIGKTPDGKEPNGYTIKSTFVSDEGDLIIIFTSGERINLGRVRGEDGVGIAGMYINDSGELVVTLTDGTVLNLGSIKGEDGIGIADTRLNEKGELVITYTDGVEVNLGSIIGEKGEDGVGIGSITLGDDYELEITLTDGSFLSLGSIRGEEGKSAYDLYCEIYGYSGNEQDWLFDLVNGNLGLKKQYTVSFNSDGGASIPSILVIQGGKLDEPIPPTRVGYSFLGWYVGEEKWVFSGHTVTEDITLTAHWQLVPYQITYNTSGGENPPSNPESYTISTPTFALLGATRPHYRFVGWFTEENGGGERVETVGGGMTGNITLYAHYVPLESYTVTYELNGGKAAVGNPDTVDKDTSFTLLAPTRAGYEFDGWYTDEALTSPITYIAPGTDRDITLYASWSAAFNYTLNDGVIHIQSYRGRATEVVVPAYIDGYKVYSIGPECFYANSTITGITLSPGIERIEENAIYYCSALREIHIPDSVTYIGSSNLGICTSLKDVHLSVNVENRVYGFLEYSAPSRIYVSDVLAFASSGISFAMSSGEANWQLYSGGSLVEELVIPGGTQINGDFCGCASIKSITIEEGVTFSDEMDYGGVFVSMRGLTSVVIKCKSLPRALFAGCRSLTSVSLPDGLTSLPIGLFSGCAALETVALPSALKTIGANAFEGCSSLSAITIPEGVEVIGDRAFMDCISLVSLRIPASVTTLYESAGGECNFARGCTSLVEVTVAPGNTAFKSVDGVLYSFDGATLIMYPAGRTAVSFDIPEGTADIMMSSFLGALYLEEITVPGSGSSIGTGAVMGCTTLRRVSLNEGVATIGQDCVVSCTNLAEVNLPMSLTKIDHGAFRGCSSLVSVNFVATDGWEHKSSGTPETYFTLTPEQVADSAFMAEFIKSNSSFLFRRVV
ncbi:MAG: leucine-rich repeat protein [Clostridia bacterium]|nr:leucine-rich repeat protein [Clostridia bacterium]